MVFFAAPTTAPTAAPMMEPTATETIPECIPSAMERESSNQDDESHGFGAMKSTTEADTAIGGDDVPCLLGYTHIYITPVYS